MRYDAMLGFNTKQFWIYDNENDTFIDPPIDVLEKANEIAYGNETTSESIDEAQNYLIKLANTEPDWLHDGHEYEDIEI